MPKGSLIEHRNVVRLLKTDSPLFDFNDLDVWTMFHSFCFDFSVWEMYGALLFGGKLIIISSLMARDPHAFLAILKNERVTVLNQTPSSFYNLIRCEQENDEPALRLRYVIFGGESLSPGRLSGWRTRYPHTRLINMYGITETTVHVTYKEITEQDIRENTSSIGKPIPTLTCYVLDQCRQLVPIGVMGELYVGGDGVSRGYLNKKDLTSQRFIESPFKAGERLYRSGDKVKRLENVELEYYGRRADQMTARGYRVELGEIGKVLSGHGDVEESVVVLRRNGEEAGDLVAYVVGKATMDAGAIRSYLLERLPSYMVPGYIGPLSELPQPSNGKSDKRRLPEPAGLPGPGSVEYVGPGNETESELVLVWQEVLGRERVGIKDNFLELGGDSVKATRLASQIYKQFNVRITLNDLFAKVNVEEQGKWIAQAVKARFSEIRSAAEQVHYPLSASQRRIWVLSQFEQGSVAYNMPGLYVLEGDLEKEALIKSFAALMDRHEILRRVFQGEEQGEMRQNIRQAEGMSGTVRHGDRRYR